jgi:hypothetical protein
MTIELREYVPGSIWLCRYRVHYVGTVLDARMTLVRLADGSVLVHSPCEIDAEAKAAILTIGPVAAIVAPGTFHHLHTRSAQAAFPDAKTFICPGVEGRAPGLRYDGVLDDTAPDLWRGQLEQVLVRGSHWMREVAFYHPVSRTLILVDIVENITGRTRTTNWQLRLWWKVVFRMWNRPKPAPEYQFGWRDKRAARLSLRRVLAWDFERVVIAHGDLIEARAHAVVAEAWSVPLQAD